MSFFLAAATVGSALLFSVYMFRQTSRAQSYSDLDLMYADILKIGLDHPEFRSPEKTSRYKTVFSGDDLRQYETYAFMAWNVCETVYDRTSKHTRRTWEPVVHAEMRLHHAWMSDPGNRRNFKDEFLEYLDGLDAVK